MIPVILMSAYAICIDHISNIESSNRAQAASYATGYESCAKIVPYVEALERKEWAAVAAEQVPRDMATLADALAAIPIT